MCAQTLSRVRLFATPWTIARQASLSVGFFWQEYWHGVPLPPSGYLLDPGIKLASLMSPALAGGFFTTSTTWEAPAKVLLLLLLSHFSHVRLCVTP